MVFNPFVIKKYVVLLLVPLISVIGFFIGNVYYGFMVSMLILAVMLGVGFIIGNTLLKNPFTMLLEGKGLLAINLDSTGILRPFIISVKSPYIHGNFQKNEIKDVFDRATVLHLAAPVKNDIPAERTKEGGLKFELSEKAYNRFRFAMFHYPVLLWNDQLKTFLTKDYLADGEKTSFAEHNVLYLNRQLEDLTKHIRNFGRYIVDNLKPKGQFLKSPIFWVIIIIFIVVMLLLFAPAIVETFAGTFGSAKEAIGGAAGGSIIPAT